MRLRTRVDALETVISEATHRAVQRALSLLTDREEREALAEVLEAELGEGGPVSPEVRALAERGATRIWEGMTPLERSILWGNIPLPHPKEARDE
jgi:hypothetical protein